MTALATTAQDHKGAGQNGAAHEGAGCGKAPDA